MKVLMINLMKRSCVCVVSSMATGTKLVVTTVRIGMRSLGHDFFISVCVTCLQGRQLAVTALLAGSTYNNNKSVLERVCIVCLCVLVYVYFDTERARLQFLIDVWESETRKLWWREGERAAKDGWECLVEWLPKGQVGVACQVLMSSMVIIPSCIARGITWNLASSPSHSLTSERWDCEVPTSGVGGFKTPLFVVVLILPKL